MSCITVVPLYYTICKLISKVIGCHFLLFVLVHVPHIGTCIVHYQEIGKELQDAGRKS